MINQINNQNAQNVNNLMTNVYKNKPEQNEEVGAAQNQNTAEKNKPAVNNLQETTANSQANTTVGKAVDILA